MGLEMTILRIAFVLLLLAAVPHAQPAVTASGGWATEAAAGGTASVYLSVDNPTMYDIYVVSATSDAAGKVELREGDKAVKTITVASFGSAELAPGAAYLQLSELKRPLKAGDEVTVTLTTDGGITVAATAVVKTR
jgi:copper(I)-binding protein